MTHPPEFWELKPLSDQQLLASLSAVLRTKRRALAELVAHLGEVEERRLHLEAAYGSMFAYCVSRLGMSEDEACRRIQLARLARRFPALFPELASGRISLSVAVLLEPVLSAANHLELLAVVRGHSVRQARELVAARFPSPDVPSSIRKLPEPRPAKERNAVEHSSSLPALSPVPSLLPESPVPSLLPESLLPESPVGSVVPMSSVAPIAAGAASALAIAEAPGALRAAQALIVTLLPSDAPPVSSSRIDANSERFALRVPLSTAHRDRIEPLSAQRYKVQFTADADLKAKLEQARDLLRHALPSGDFGAILSRALELLIADLLRRRFGSRARREKTGAGSEPLDSSAAKPAVAAPPSTSSVTASSATASKRSPAARVGRAARRAVLERDGLGCAWVDANGTRCAVRAWLEFDHRCPVGRGGGSEPQNVRLLCRAHNHLAAEHEYGREYIERVSAARRGERA